MHSQHFFVGKGERIVITILLLIVSSGAVLFSLDASHWSECPSAIAPADTIYDREHYVGPPAHLRQTTRQKFATRRVLDLNAVDSLTLIRVPGIGPAFSHRIIALRERLGGYYTVLQLQEVYGMDEDKFLSLRGWFRVLRPTTTYRLDSLHRGNIPRHPYLSYAQSKALARLAHRYGEGLRWRHLMREATFTHEDSVRLSPYFVDR